MSLKKNSKYWYSISVIGDRNYDRLEIYGGNENGRWKK